MVLLKRYRSSRPCCRNTKPRLSRKPASFGILLKAALQSSSADSRPTSAVAFDQHIELSAAGSASFAFAAARSKIRSFRVPAARVFASRNRRQGRLLGRVCRRDLPVARQWRGEADRSGRARRHSALDRDGDRSGQRRHLLAGISGDVAELLKDKPVGHHAFQKLRKMKLIRQLEVAELMVSANNYTVSYAKALLATSKPSDLHKPDELRSRLASRPSRWASRT